MRNNFLNIILFLFLKLIYLIFVGCSVFPETICVPLNAEIGRPGPYGRIDGGPTGWSAAAHEVFGDFCVVVVVDGDDEYLSPPPPPSPFV